MWIWIKDYFPLRIHIHNMNAYIYMTTECNKVLFSPIHNVNVNMNAPTIYNSLLWTPSYTSRVICGVAVCCSVLQFVTMGCIWVCCSVCFSVFHMNIHSYQCVCVCVYVCVCECMCVCVCAYVHIHECVYVCIHIPLCVCIYIHVCVTCGAGTFATISV